jgi:arginine N-succinyltransferase
MQMSFLVREVRKEDLDGLFQLAKHFTLLNLPADRSKLEPMIESSVESFAGKREKKDATYIFVIEDTETRKVIATSLILAKHGHEDIPHYSFKIIKKDHFSQDIGIGFIHQVLRFTEDKDGPSEIGGLLLDPSYRNRPEKLGAVISLIRFLYMGMYKERFEKRVLCELSPPLTPEGRSEFWEALGRRFTGLPYVEADQISQTNKEFIKTLFPTEDIYLTLLDARARVDIGRVGDVTEPAKHMLEKMGFVYLNEVDPFDGGPHFGANLEEIKVIKEMKSYPLSVAETQAYGKMALIAVQTKAGFRGGLAYHDVRNNEISLPRWIKDMFAIEVGDKVFVYNLN